MRGARVPDAARHAGQRALVQDGVDAATGIRDGSRVGEVRFDEVDLRRDVSEPAGGEVVEPAHAIAARQQRVRKVRADKTRYSGDEVGSQQG